MRKAEHRKGHEMKIKHNCTEMSVSTRLSFWEIETENSFDYYVEIKGYPMAFDFGSSKDNKHPRMGEEELLNLLKEDYFRTTLESIVDNVDELDPIYDEFNIQRISVCCTGSCFWEAYTIVKGKLYVITNECPQNLMMFEYANRKEEEPYMPDDMIFDLHNSELSPNRKKIYDKLHSEFIAKADEWGFCPNLYEE